MRERRPDRNWVAALRLSMTYHHGGTILIIIHTQYYMVILLNFPISNPGKLLERKAREEACVRAVDSEVAR